jgi:ribose 5-phosphate isomerase B
MNRLAAFPKSSSMDWSSKDLRFGATPLAGIDFGPYGEGMTQDLVYIASDHRGFALKTHFVDFLRAEGYQVEDLGPSDDTRCDAMDYAVKLAEAMRDKPDARGILICMTGQVMTMTANKYRHLRAALCLNTTMARLAREHNDANVLVLGSHIVGLAVAEDCLKTFLTTACLGGRYAERCRLLADLGGL